MLESPCGVVANSSLDGTPKNHENGLGGHWSSARGGESDCDDGCYNEMRERQLIMSINE